MGKRVVLAYSGGLDTSVSIRWLQERYGAEVITVSVDVGQLEDLEEVGERAKALGVKRHYTIDAKEEFARDYIFRAIKANALYQGRYPLGTALTRPLIAQKLVEVARKEDADAVAHGCTGKGNDQVRFDITIKALEPELEIIAPIRDWSLSRDFLAKYAEEHGIPLPPKRSLYSIDANLWGRALEGGSLEDVSQEPPADAYEWVKPLEEVPEEPLRLTINFEEGVPIGLDGQELQSVELIQILNRRLGAHGFGIIDHLEDRTVGLKTREVYECPAALALIEAHKELEKLVLTNRELKFKRMVDEEWAELVYNGLWIEPLRYALEGFIAQVQRRVTGSVGIKVHKGNLRIVSRSSGNSLYDIRMATYEGPSTFDPSLARGFIELWGLQAKMAYRKLMASYVKGVERS